MKVPFMDLDRCKPKGIEMRMEEVIRNNRFINGTEKSEFEREWANYCGTNYCIGVDSGTSALVLSLKALGIGPGDEVVTVPNSFFATAYAIRAVGAKPVFVDINPDTYLMDINNVKKVITSKTKAILPVHLYGQPTSISPLRQFNLPIIEDSCQAHGALYGGQKVGSVGDIAAFSFYPAKNLGCYGDGGAVTTNNPDLADRVRMLHNYGQREKYLHEVEGGNHRLDTLQAAVLLAKLPFLDQWNKYRQKAARQYLEELKDENRIMLPKTANGRMHVYHLFVVRSKNRHELQEYLRQQGIDTGIHYPVPLHMTEALKHLGYKKDDFPIAEKIANEIVSLPMFPKITESEVGYVCDKIKQFNKRGVK